LFKVVTVTAGFQDLTMVLVVTGEYTSYLVILVKEAMHIFMWFDCSRTQLEFV